MTSAPDAPDTDEYIKDGCTVTYMAVDGKYAGFIALADTLRDEATEMISSVREMGITPVLLTGDNESRSAHLIRGGNSRGQI